MNDSARLTAVRRAEVIDTAHDPTFDSLTKAAAEILGAPYSLISIVGDARSTFTSTYGIPAEMRSEDASDSFCQYVIASEASLFAADVRTHPLTMDNPTIEAKGARAWAGCPILLDGRILGTLCVIDTTARTWSDSERATLQTLANIASHEILLRVQLRELGERNDATGAELDRVQTLLSTIRESLLPPTLPVVPGLDIGSWFEAASDGEELLGDFYDVFPLGEHTWGCVIGDVCGHGVEAAKLTSLIRYTVRAAAIQHLDPAEVAYVLDTALRTNSIEPGRFATICYLRITLGDTISVDWCRAGHPAPVMISAAGDTSLCEEASGPLLGVVDAIDAGSWTVGHRVLTPNESMVLYTDGLPECRSDVDGSQLGAEGLLRAARDGRRIATTAAGIAEYLGDLVRARSSSRTDDTAIVCLSAIGR